VGEASSKPFQFSLSADFEIAEEIEILDVNLMEAYVPPAPRSDAGQSADSESMSVPSGIPEPVQKMMVTIEQFQQTIDQKKEALNFLSAQ
jgi:hypothetical protein